MLLEVDKVHRLQLRMLRLWHRMLRHDQLRWLQLWPSSDLLSR